MLNRSYLIEDYQRDSQGLDIEAMIFVECDADFVSGDGQCISEIEFVEEQARQDPRILGIVAKAPLELGTEAEPLIERIVAQSPKMRGVRRIVEFAADPRALMLSPGFIEGVTLLGKFGLHFEITVNYAQMDIALEFARRIVDVPLILDHCGKPGIRGQHFKQFQRQMTELAVNPNIFCKLSDLPVEADRQSWSDADLTPFIDATIAAFGVDRVIYGGDWPVCLQATSMQRWVATLDRALAGFSESDLRKIYRDNAIRFYRLGV